MSVLLSCDVLSKIHTQTNQLQIQPLSTLQTISCLLAQRWADHVSCNQVLDNFSGNPTNHDDRIWMTHTEEAISQTVYVTAESPQSANKMGGAGRQLCWLLIFAVQHCRPLFANAPMFVGGHATQIYCHPCLRCLVAPASPVPLIKAPVCGWPLAVTLQPTNFGLELHFVDS